MQQCVAGAGPVLLQAEHDRLGNAVGHLVASNEQLQAAMRNNPDPEYRRAIGENIVVIAKYRSQMEALQQEIAAAQRGAGVDMRQSLSVDMEAGGGDAEPMSTRQTQDFMAEDLPRASSNVEAMDAAPTAGADPAAGGASAGSGAADMDADQQQLQQPPPQQRPAQQQPGGGVWL